MIKKQSTDVSRDSDQVYSAESKIKSHEINYYMPLPPFAALHAVLPELPRKRLSRALALPPVKWQNDISTSCAEYCFI